MKLVFVYGPTCSGKTELGIQLSEEFGGEIISCDSVQVYKELEIGSAKPNKEELARAKHHLVSIVSYPEKYSAAKFHRDASKLLKQMESDGHELVYVVGGTGFYFQALETGMDRSLSVPSNIANDIRDRAENNLPDLYKDLELADPVYASRISENDSYRIARAMELVYLGKLPSEEFVKKKSQLPYEVLKIFINPDRTELRTRMQKRTQKMLELGLLEEVESLLDKGYGDWEALQSVGYKECLEVIQKAIPEEELEYWISTRSMQLAKRQRTWFQRDKEALEIQGPNEFDKAKKAVRAFLGVEK
jgi:tRNA dimethylallyltransferase